MKITLRNWWCWPDNTLDFSSQAVFVLGHNGSGKTSGVRDSLEFAFCGTGRLRGGAMSHVMTKKELARFAIREGAMSCEVTVELAGIRTRRTMDREGSQELFRSTWVDDNPHPSEGRWSEEEACSTARDKGNPYGTAPDDLVRCMLEPTHFATLEPQRRQEILITATSEGGVSLEDALNALSRRLESENDHDLSAIESAAGWIVDEGFRGAEEAAIDQRKRAKRERAECIVGEPPEPIVQVGGIELDLAASNLEGCMGEVDELRTAHTAAVRIESAGAGAMAGKLAEAEEWLGTIAPRPMEDFPLLEKRVREAVAQHAAALQEDDPGIPIPVEDRRAALEALTQELEWAKSTTAGVVVSRRAEITAEETRLAASDAFPRPPECPKGPPGMRCPVKPSVWGPAVEKARGDKTKQAAAIDRLRGELVIAGKTAAEGVEALALHYATLEKHKKALRVYGTQLEDHRQYVEKIRAAAVRETSTAEILRKARADAADHWAEQKAGAEGRVEKARKALEAVRDGDTPEGPSVGDLADAIGQRERIVEVARSYWLARDSWDQRRVSAAELEAAVTMWDSICRELKPDGVETELGGGARDRFLELLSQTSHLSGEIALDSECGITVATGPGGRPKHPLQLSTSQRLAMGCAIQHALCQLLGWPVLVVDAADTFRGSMKLAWIDFAASIAHNYPGGVFGLASIEDGAPPAPPAPWSTLWLKPDGTMAQIGGGDF